MSKPSPAEAGQKAARTEYAHLELLTELKELSEQVAEDENRMARLLDRAKADPHMSAKAVVRLERALKALSAGNQEALEALAIA